MDKSAAPPKRGLTYASAGVNIEAGNQLVEALKPLAESTKQPGSEGHIGGFGGLFDLKAAGFKDPILVAANDGVGTKVKIAIETGEHDRIGIDLVAMCVNDLIAQGARPLFFLDYFACAALDIAEARTVIAGVAEGCRQAGAVLLGGETAEMPGLYRDRDYDLAGFAVGAVERGETLPREDIEAGDLVIGLASTGAHSNGFSLIRRIVDELQLDWQDKAPFASDQTLGEALLTPTRIYVKPVLQLLEIKGQVKAIAHITGGGMVENISRILPPHLGADIDLQSFSVLPVFKWIAEEGEVEDHELLRTFNCGIGLVMVVSLTSASRILEALAKSGEPEAVIIGHIIERPQGEAVRFSGQMDLSS